MGETGQQQARTVCVMLPTYCIKDSYGRISFISIAVPWTTQSDELIALFWSINLVSIDLLDYELCMTFI